MGRAARAGVRVGLFVCLCLCRERPPCEGFILSVTAEGSEGFPECATSCSLGRHGQRSVHSGFPPEECENPKKGFLLHPFEEHNQPGSWVVGG